MAAKRLFDDSRCIKGFLLIFATRNFLDLYREIYIFLTKKICSFSADIFFFILTRRSGSRVDKSEYFLPSEQVINSMIDGNFEELM